MRSTALLPFMKRQLSTDPHPRTASQLFLLQKILSLHDETTTLDQNKEIRAGRSVLPTLFTVSIIAGQRFTCQQSTRTECGVRKKKLQKTLFYRSCT
ncbi:hypothetical protein DPX16_4063 [Anabarilius grahami]|uniref:Uncharacterized protein n=1 Tax=Anabarilius grahami TaxID=495550 RepID=A0A3N0Y003_ANAGA|nr:hypothetical protein DPX16_4063 [Anabarilius grahami]